MHTELGSGVSYWITTNTNYFVLVWVLFFHSHSGHTFIYSHFGAEVRQSVTSAPHESLHTPAPCFSPQGEVYATLIMSVSHSGGLLLATVLGVGKGGGDSHRLDLPH